MSTQPACRSCGLENEARRDFCTNCGEYLSWAPTAFVAVLPGGDAAPAAIVSPPPEPPPEPESISIVLTPADPGLGTAGVPAVQAGAMLSFVATVRNESQTAGDYDLAVLGLPESWALVATAAAVLMPLGSSRGQGAQEVRIDIAPPREYRSTAGIWTFELVALSRTTAAIAARAVAQFEVKAFPAWSVEVAPLVNSGRLRARYRTAVRNDGNAEQCLWLIAATGSGRARARFRAGTLTLQAGEVGVDVLTLRARFPLAVGRTIEHRVGVDALPEQPETGEDHLGVREMLAPPAAPSPTARQIVFRQKPVIPLWLIAALTLAAIAAYVVYAQLPDRTNVPSIVGAVDSFAAEKQLRQKGLQLSQPVQRRVDRDAEAGSVIEQSPAAGMNVDKGAQVSIVVADAASQISVPRLKDLTRLEAGARLREDGLVLGDTRPADAPATFVVRSQIPAAGLSVDRGSTVRVFLGKPPLTKKEKAAATKKSRGAARDAGPQPGQEAKKGATVGVRAAGGSSMLAVETDGRVLLFDPASGRQTGQIPAGEGSASELSYVPGAGQAVYRSDTGLVVAGLGKARARAPSTRARTCSSARRLRRTARRSRSSAVTRATATSASGASTART